MTLPSWRREYSVRLIGCNSAGIFSSVSVDTKVV
jgi:hypothetical protein